MTCNGTKIGNNNSILNEVDKLDRSPVTGLTGTADSIGYKITEIEKHFHNAERWLGKKATQTATDWAEDTLTPFVAISGLNSYGQDASDEALVLGTGDTPNILGKVKFDPYRIYVSDLSSNTVYKLRMSWGTGTMADAITAGQYSEVMIATSIATGNRSGGIPVDFRCPRLRCGTDKVWVQAWNESDNATCSFFIGLHEYDG